jgi:ribosomal-protein-alanine N-acetyltransferase
MDAFPELHTPRLHLRRIRPEDVPALVKYANNKKIADNIVNIPYPYREPEAALRVGSVLKGFKTGARFAFAIISKERDELIGEVSLNLMDKNNPHGQLAYWIGEPFWNQGIATEAVAEVIKFGFEQLGLELIYADFYRDNKSSEKVTLKNGMSWHSQKGNTVLHKITREEYHSQADAE